MKKLLSSVLFLVFFLSVILAQKAEKNDDSLNLDVVISEINKSLVLAQNKIENLNLISAEISLQTSKGVDGGGKVKFFVKAGHTWERGNTITMVYSFTPTIQQEFIKTEAEVKPFSSSLAEAISDASTEFISSQNQISGLVKEKFKVILNFSITKTTDGGIEFEVFGIGVDAGVSFSKEKSHNITLVFNEKSD